MGFPLLSLEPQLQLQQATLLKNVLDALSGMFSEANFEFSTKGCELQALDTRGVALVSFLLPADAFYRYSCYRDLSMGLNIADMAGVLRCADDDDIITIKVDPLAFKIESPKTGVISYFYSFYFDDVDVDGVPLQLQLQEESEYQAKVCLPSTQFMHICEQLSVFGDREDRDTGVVISVDKENVSFYTRWKTGTATATIPKGPALVEMKEEVSLMFALRYIKAFSKASIVSDRVTISLSSKKPAVFEYKIAEMAYIRYYMLPVDRKSA